MNDRKTTVSLCMIVRNEERQLAECLRPVASLFDEIVIVDTGSTDGTRRIAAEFTPHVFDFSWCDDFSAARNEALRHSHGQWIFWLDADDRLDEINVARLKTLLDGLDDGRRVYFMNTGCPSQYACEVQNLIDHGRLFRRHPEIRWQGRVHEQLRPEPELLGYELHWSDVQIQHLGYCDEAALHRKLNRDVRLLRMDYAVDPDDCSTLVHLGLAHLHLGRHGDAREYLRTVLAQTKTPCNHLRQVYAALATIAIREGNLPEAIATLDQAITVFPYGEYLLYQRAECLYELDRFAECKETLTRIVTGSAHRQYRYGVPDEIREKLAPRLLAEVLRLERNFSTAEALLTAIVDRHPHDTHTWYMLGRIYLDWEQRVQFITVVEHLRACPQGEIFASLLQAIWHINTAELTTASRIIDEVIELAPQMPFARIMRADCLEKSGAPLDERMQAWRDILRLQPGNQAARETLARLEQSQRRAAAIAAPSLVIMPGSSAIAAP